MIHLSYSGGTVYINIESFMWVTTILLLNHLTSFCQRNLFHQLLTPDGSFEQSSNIIHHSIFSQNFELSRSFIEYTTHVFWTLFVNESPGPSGNYVVTHNTRCSENNFHHSSELDRRLLDCFQP